jgi:hypothetical protein
MISFQGATMLEIGFIIIVVAAAVVLWKRPKKKNAAHDKMAVYTCPQCGEKDCHCERRA